MHNPLAMRRKIFRQIIVKCVLQLLLIEMINELLRNNDVYHTIPPDQLLLLMRELDHSYQFARAFNDDKELRTGLWKVGMLKQSHLISRAANLSVTRLYEAPTQPSQTGIEQCSHTCAHPSTHVLRHEIRLSYRSTSNSR